MKDFSASLVREKLDFSWDVTQADVPLGLEEAGKGTAGGATSRSNRIALHLDGATQTEHVVVRAQNMHMALRMASKLMFSFYRSGIFTGREHPFNWQECWNAITSGYDKDYAPDHWGAVYVSGQPVFKTKNSPLIDIIEQCALLDAKDYDSTLGMAESAFHKLGHNIEVSHSTRIASVFKDAENTMRCGIMHRNEAGGDTTFNFSARGGETYNRVVESLRITASFLEGNNLRFVMNDLQKQLKEGTVAPSSAAADQLRRATSRLMGINRVIGHFEEVYNVQYRPEKPNFFRKT